MIRYRIVKMCLLVSGLLLLTAAGLRAGNLRIRDEVRIVSAENNYFTLSVSLDWENSWYDDHNFDAVWLFMKYRTPEQTDWTHLFLAPAGHEVPGGYLTGESGSESVGLFVWSKTQVDGKAVLSCKIKCVMPAGVTKADIDANRLYFAVQGIEMVYVPAGAFYLGDGLAAGSFRENTGIKPVLVGSETALSLMDTEGNAYVLGEDYPKGYNGFFVMKTEITQGQYVDFLNLLPLMQQYARVPDIYSMAEGAYIFTGAATPQARNGIRLKKKSTSPPTPCIFINDLDRNGVNAEAEDGQAIACGYLSAQDIYAYCSWAGLRPMAETEFEKAGRRLFPLPALAGEYPWNTVAGAFALTDAELVNKNSLIESAAQSGKNVNATGLRADPVRGGAFAATTGTAGTAQKAGATVWGLFEMAGNLRECVISAAADDFTADCGSGDAGGGGIWSGAMARGGGFLSDLSRLQISDRTGFTEVTDETARQADFGGRGCRSVVASGAGTIVGMNHKICDTVCVEEECRVNSATLPQNSAEVSAYRWVVREGGTEVWKLIPAENGSTLLYEPDTRPAGTSRLYFRRIAHARMGDLLSNEVEIVFINNDLRLSCLKDTVDKCGEAAVIEALHYKAGKITWSAGGHILLTQDGVNGTGYLPDRSLGASGAEIMLICQSVIDACQQSVVVPVFIETEAVDPASECWSCGDNVADSDGTVYRTVATSDGRCWMQENMKRNVSGSHIYPGADPDVYGRLYTWPAAMNGKDFEGARGICPEGWKIPAYDEWQALIAVLGGNAVAGGAMQNSGLRLSLGGGQNAGVGNFVGLDQRGDYWSATAGQTGVNALGITVKMGDSSISEYDGDIQNAVSVRCVKNK